MKLLKFISLLFFGLITIVLITGFVVSNALNNSLFNEEYIREYYGQYDVADLMYSELKENSIYGVSIESIDETSFKDEVDSVAGGLLDYIHGKEERLPNVNIAIVKEIIRQELDLTHEEIEYINTNLEAMVISMVGNIRSVDVQNNLTREQLLDLLSESESSNGMPMKEKFIDSYMENRTLSNDQIVEKFMNQPEVRVCCLFLVSDEVDLNKVFNKENKNNVFGVIRNGRIMQGKITYYYLPIYILLFALIIGIISYSVKTTLLSYGTVLMFSSVLSYILHLSNYLVIMQINQIENPFIIKALNQLVQDVFSSTTRYSLILFIGFVVCILSSFFFEAVDKKRLRMQRFIFVLLVIVCIGYYSNEQSKETDQYRTDVESMGNDPNLYYDQILNSLIDTPVNLSD